MSRCSSPIIYGVKLIVGIIGSSEMLKREDHEFIGDILQIRILDESRGISRELREADPDLVVVGTIRRELLPEDERRMLEEEPAEFYRYLSLENILG